MDETLAICIPTYNRANFLKESLENLVPQVSPFSIPIYISDNASPDITEKVVEAFQSVYPYIFYSRNRENLGSDKNIETVLKMSKSRYSLLLSDDDRLVEGSIKKILEIVNNKDYDLMVLNATDRIKDIKSQEYSDCNNLLSDLGWHMTLMSCLIYSKKVIDSDKFRYYYKTSFPQTLVVFDYLATKKDFLVYWLDEELIYPAANATCSFKTDFFEIFAKRWTEGILSLPDAYTNESKYKCIKDHGVKSRIFLLRNMRSLRRQGYYNFQIFRKYLRYFPYTTDLPISLLFLLSVSPRSVIQIFG